MENMHDNPFRMERDSLGEVRVPLEHLWGAQTQRSFENFLIGQPQERMPMEIIYAFAQLKKACAKANHQLRPACITQKKRDAIIAACDAILDGRLDDEFPLVVFQTGSGTQTNMNVNEVIAHYAKGLHPNDDVNASQSSNDTFPSAMHIAFVSALETSLLPSLQRLKDTFLRKEKQFQGIMKAGRTHMMDAVPLRFSQELSGYRFSLEQDEKLLRQNMDYLKELAIGATAVGTGLNAPKGFDSEVCRALQEQMHIAFVPGKNKFHALTSLDEIVVTHGALKALAMDMFKMANDIRLAASGPRCGLNELILPANEPGSSIMPGKVNPTQCEQVTQVAVQIAGNDASISFAASQGQFELCVFFPVTAYNFLQSVRLLAQSMDSFRIHLLEGLEVNKEQMCENLHRSLMLSTLLSPAIGYEKAAQIAQLAHQNKWTLKEAAMQSGYMTADEFDQVCDPEKAI